MWLFGKRTTKHRHLSATIRNSTSTYILKGTEPAVGGLDRTYELQGYICVATCSCGYEWAYLQTHDFRREVDIGWAKIKLAAEGG